MNRLEFLTDNSTRERSATQKLSGVTAQKLSYMSLAYDNAIEFSFSDGPIVYRGMVVSPGAYIFHKGLIFPERRKRSKKYKDLYGMAYVCSQISWRSPLKSFQEVFLSSHPSWQRTFIKNLLEAQKEGKGLYTAIARNDPSGLITPDLAQETLENLITAVKPD